MAAILFLVRLIAQVRKIRTSLLVGDDEEQAQELAMDGPGPRRPNREASKAVSQGCFSFESLHRVLLERKTS